MVRPLRVVATRLETLERVVFASGEVTQAVEASIAIPGICVPVTIDNEIYVDGGVVDPLPVDVLEEMGIEKIIAVNVIPSSEQLRYWRERELEATGGKRKFSVRRWLNQQVNYFAAGNVFDTMVQAFNGAQMLVAETTGRRADVVLRPVSCESFWCDFTHPQKYIKLGRDAAEAQLAQLLALTAPASDEHPTLSPSDVLRAA
jgi:NTE family protein